nr:hypothetical protein Iba_chr12eCG13420 [Ipomoea batatas]
MTYQQSFHWKCQITMGVSEARLEARLGLRRKPNAMRRTPLTQGMRRPPRPPEAYASGTPQGVF